MAELAFLGALISALTTFGKMIYEEIKKAHEEARAKITETKETILLVMNGEACGPRNFQYDDDWLRAGGSLNFKKK
jgi:hypothetical protein